MSEEKREPEALLERVRQRLDESAAQLDPTTVERLRQARRQAMALAAETPRPWWRPRRSPADWWLPAGAFTSVVATVLALALLAGEPGDVPLPGSDDLELLTAGEELELFENLEFYQWLPESELAG